MWLFKYAPKTLEECAGNDEPRAQMKTWALEWNMGKGGKPLLLAGPPGCGKTAACHALAQQMGWALAESGASDERGKEEMQKLFGSGSSSMTLFGERRCILVEDVDSVVERGEVPELLRLIGGSRSPIIFTANDAWEQKIASLRANCKVVEFKAVNTRSTTSVLTKIAAAEKVSSELVESVAAASKGDLRSAIIDFEFGTSAMRERKANVFRAVGKIFNATTYKDAVAASDEADVDLDMLYRWIEENVPAEYEDPNEVAGAFGYLSRADVFKGRITKRQHWGFLKYYRALATAGVALSKRKRYFKFTRYAFPQYIKALSAGRASKAARVGLARKAGHGLHCSHAQALETLAIVRPPAAYAVKLELGESEADYFKENYATAAKKEKK